MCMTHISPRRAAERLGVSVSTVRRMFDTGDLRGFRTTGGHRRIELESLRRLVMGRGQVKITFPTGSHT